MSRKLKESNIKNCLKELDQYFASLPEACEILPFGIQSRIKAKKSLDHLKGLLLNKEDILTLSCADAVGPSIRTGVTEPGYESPY